MKLTEAYNYAISKYGYEGTRGAFYQLMRDKGKLIPAGKKGRGNEAAIEKEKVDEYYREVKFIKLYSINALCSALDLSSANMHYFLLKNPEIKTIKLQNHLCVVNEEEKQNAIRIYRESKKTN